MTNLRSIHWMCRIPLVHSPLVERVCSLSIYVCDQSGISSPDVSYSFGPLPTYCICSRQKVKYLSKWMWPIWDLFTGCVTFLWSTPHLLKGFVASVYDCLEYPKGQHWKWWRLYCRQKLEMYLGKVFWKPDRIPIRYDYWLTGWTSSIGRTGFSI